ncbi:MAG TPA: TonB family protein [Terracidiphilus sp.]
MFEDSTFETMGRIHTRSRGWMMATLTFNSSILLALVIIPILHPRMLPQMTFIDPIDAPAPVEQQRPVVRTEQVQTARPEMQNGVIQAPRLIPSKPWIPGAGDDPGPIGPVNLGSDPSAMTSADNPFNGRGTQPVVRAAVPATQHVTSGVMEGMLIYKVVPTYPAMAQAIRASGTVVLQATISRTGTIENLRVVEGPPLLRQATLDAVEQWRYKPYMLNGQPIEVETTVNVQFTLE